MQTIIGWDRLILRHINADWHNPFFDWLMPIVRIAETWAPFYLFMLVFGIVNFKKTAWWWILMAVVTAVLSDYISSDLIKPNFFRLRPCNEPAIADWIRLFPGIYRPQSSSFTSSHATNHFAIATYFFLTLKNRIGKWTWLFFAWAALVCYAQMYVGVHYPFDILAGALVGTILGFGTATFFNIKWPGNQIYMA